MQPWSINKRYKCSREQHLKILKDEKKHGTCKELKNIYGFKSRKLQNFQFVAISFCGFYHLNSNDKSSAHMKNWMKRRGMAPLRHQKD